MAVVLLLWCYVVFGEPTLADAILDRIVHNAHRLQLTGDSLRKKAPKPATA
jgi:DNA replication protein DnaC